MTRATNTCSYLILANYTFTVKLSEHTNEYVSLPKPKRSID